MDWIDGEVIWLFFPRLADVFVGGEPLQRFQPSSKIVGRHEVGDVASQLSMIFVMVAFDCCLFEGPVHSLHLAVCPRMIGFGQTMLDAVSLARLIERVGVMPRGPPLS